MTKNTKAAILMLPALLGGCFATSVRGMREREPVLVSDSARDATAISICVAEKWVALGLTPRTIPRANGTTIMVEQAVTYGLPVLLVDLDTGTAGTHVTMHQLKTVWSRQNRQRVEEVRACL